MVELTNSYRQLEEYTYDNKELKQFAYISSHQFQQPVRTIKNFIQILQEDYGSSFDDKANRYLKTIKDSTERMNSLILALSDYSQLGHKENLQPGDFKELINDVLADLDALIKTSGTIIEVSEMPLLNACKDEIRQVFQNLIVNVIKFQEKGSLPKIQISSEQISNRWKFSVSDNGIVIPAEQYEIIFNIFQRLHRIQKILKER